MKRFHVEQPAELLTRSFKVNTLCMCWWLLYTTPKFDHIKTGIFHKLYEHDFVFTFLWYQCIHRIYWYENMVNELRICAIWVKINHTRALFFLLDLFLFNGNVQTQIVYLTMCVYHTTSSFSETEKKQHQRNITVINKNSD